MGWRVDDDGMVLLWIECVWIQHSSFNTSLRDSLVLVFDCERT
jgi:hypothetical protein